MHFVSWFIRIICCIFLDSSRGFPVSKIALTITQRATMIVLLLSDRYTYKTQLVFKIQYICWSMAKNYAHLTCIWCLLPIKDLLPLKPVNSVWKNTGVIGYRASNRLLNVWWYFCNSQTDHVFTYTTMNKSKNKAGTTIKLTCRPVRCM